MWSFVTDWNSVNKHPGLRCRDDVDYHLLVSVLFPAALPPFLLKKCFFDTSSLILFFPIGGHAYYIMQCEHIVYA